MNKAIYHFIPVGMLFISILLAHLFDAYFPLQYIISSPFTKIGLLFFLVGGFILVSFFYLFNKHKTTVLPGGCPTHLIIEGVYRFSRNPVYVADLFFIAGVAVRLGSASSFLPLLLFFTVIHTIVIPFEEKQLIAQFGDTYKAYMKRVHRWV